MAMTHITNTYIRGPRRASFLGSLAQWINARRIRRDQIKALETISEAGLKDVGITRADADAELRRLRDQHAIFPHVL